MKSITISLFTVVMVSLTHLVCSATATREALIRVLGLNTTQANSLVLPERLPNLPATVQNLNKLSSFTEMELGLRHDTVRDLNTTNSITRRGTELTISLPIFDWGGMQREAMNAETLAAANHLKDVQQTALSHLREAYSAYRTAYDIAKHYRDEIIPLRQIIADETLLSYNGMMISVFELLADSREQLNAVNAAIAAQQQFWLANAALASTLLGKPISRRLSAFSMAKTESNNH